MHNSRKTILKSALVGVFILVAIINVSCGQSKTDKAAKIDKLVSTFAEYGRFNGSVLVAEKGEVVFKKGFGLANMEWDIPNQADTKHRLGSITKQFTSMLVLQLVQEGKLKLDVPITTYLPGYPKKNGDIITLHHLLTHTSGIPDYTSFPDFFKDKSRDPIIPAEFINLFAASALDFKPGERFQYSNSGYFLLGVIIEKVTGKTYEQVLQENILTPIKMANTGYDHHNTLLKNRASGYEKIGRTYTNANYLEMSVPFSAGALYSTVEDLYLWDQALYTEKLLSKKYMDLLFGKYVSEGRDYYGYGWFIGEIRIGNTNEQSQTIFHGGGINGFNTLITRIPADKSFIVLLNNTGGAPLGEMTMAINGILHDRPYNFPKKSVAFSVLDIMEKDGITAALSHYKQIRDSGNYRLNESEMNQAGYQLLQSNKAKEAAAMFKLNVEAFPTSFNVYDSYGEALLALGNKKEAIENYLKSVQLNPGSESGMKALKEAGVNTDTLVIKVSIEHLKLLEGDYLATNRSGSNEWKIKIREVKGELTGNDGGYQYRLIPVGNDKFINPDDGASLVFDTSDKDAVKFVIFGTTEFRKVK